MITLGPGQRVHARSNEFLPVGCHPVTGRRVRAIWAGLKGSGFVVPPPVARWRPPRAALRRLRHLHQAAVRTAEARSGVLADRETAHGLEQQVIHALVESLSAGPVDQETEAAFRHRGILGSFEDVLDAEPLPSITKISAAIGVSRRLLCECCNRHLGMSQTVTVACAECSSCTARCAAKFSMCQAYRPSPTDTVSAISATLLGPIAPFTANCLRPP